MMGSLFFIRKNFILLYEVLFTVRKEKKNVRNNYNLYLIIGGYTDCVRMYYGTNSIADSWIHSSNIRTNWIDIYVEYRRQKG